ncbi:condensation domain-containing protein [Acidisphaera sp. L21]|uniref:condensation domain-containing protein n=1 Tax=Acidisphaera sp. L21 TaxID=1641851 RepID=UPI00131DA123|nr:condensation domain-containing protein [Acidisphaera sp. L21]
MDIGTSPSSEGTGVSYPASLAQTRFWLLDALDPGTPALNVAVRWKLLGPVTHGAVEATMRRIVGRHEILRTALHNEDGIPTQLVQPALPFQVRHHDLTGMPKEAALAEADRIGAEEARNPFALEAAPLMRATLILLEPGESRLLLTLHHAICDGWSIGVLAEEITKGLAGEPPLPELPLQYGDYAEWQQAWLDSPAPRVASAYWTSQLAGLPYVIVPPDHAAQERGGGAIISTLLPRALTDGMVAMAAQQGCTPFAVALAALGQMLQARTGANDIPIGTQVAGRTEVELEGMIGPFINTLVLRLDLAGQPDWAERVARTARIVAGALDNHTMPFELLIRALNPARDARRTPLFSVNFIFQRSFVAPFEGGGITLVDLPSHSAGALYDLNFFMVERPDGWRASCEYDAALFEPATVAAMLADWRQALSGQPVAASAPADPVLETLGAIWCEILGVPGVGPTDGFFDLGGHSLLAARMLARVEAVFGQRVGMAALFADPTLGGLAARLAIPIAAKSSIGTPLVAVGNPVDWIGLQDALGRKSPFQCLSDAAPGLVTRLYPTGPIAVLGTGNEGMLAMSLARALGADGRNVTLVLVDVMPQQPRSFWRGLLSARDLGPRFDGPAILFRRPDSSPDETDGWSGYLNGTLDVVPLPPGPWHNVVAQRIGAFVG